MAKCAPQTFSNFSTECIQTLRAKVQTAGVNPEEAAGGKTSGEASRAGFKIEWSYDSTNQALTVQCTASPFYVPCKLITSQIESWVSSCYPSGQPIQA